MREHYAKSVKFLDNTSLEVSFQDGKIVRYKIKDALNIYPPLEKLLHNQDLFLSGKLVSGYGIIWNEDLDLNENIIYTDGELVGFMEPSTAEKLGLLIQSLREKHNISQTQLAKISKIDQSDISRLEKGEGNPTLLKLEKIFKALDYELSFSVNKKKRI